MYIEFEDLVWAGSKGSPMSSTPIRHPPMAQLKPADSKVLSLMRREREPPWSMRTAQRVLYLTPVYVAILVAISVLGLYLSPGWALISWGGVLALLLLHAGLFWPRAFSSIPLTLAATPLAWLIMVPMRLAEQSSLYHYLTLGIPSLAASMIAMRLLRYGWLKARMVVCLVLLVLPLILVLVYTQELALFTSLR